MNRVRDILSGGFAPSFALGAMLCGTSTPEACAAGPLTRLRDVLDLPRAALATNPAVHVRAVVTCVDRPYQAVFVQDASAGIFVFEPITMFPLSPGDEIEIRGTAARGLFSPYLNPKSITPLGKTNLPLARTVALASVAAGNLVGERVETEGMVQRVQRLDEHLFLSLVAGEDRCSIFVPLPEENELPDVLDTRVRVRGVVTVDFGRQKHPVGFHIFGNNVGDMEIVSRPPVTAWQAPICPISEIPRYAGRRSGEHRVHVRGVVTLHWPGRATVIQDTNGGVLLEKGVPLDVKVGDELDVAGFLAPLNSPNRLRCADARKVGTSPEPEIIAATLSAGDMRNNMLVRIMGRVVEWQPPYGGEVTAMLSSSNELFAAVMPEKAAEHAREDYPPGSIVGMVGVMKALAAENRGVPCAALWLRGPSDIRLLQAAPTSPWKWLSIVCGIAAFLAIAGAAVIVALVVRHRRALHGMSVRKSEAEQQFEEMERQLHRSHQDRQRIARELHDNIIQSLYSMGLGIDEAIRLGHKSPERVRERLNVAVQSLNGVIRDVRAFLLGLEPKGLEGHELKAALKSVLLTSGEDQQARFSIEIDANAARDLNSLQATEVFNIAKEAISNSMRHAHAALTKVSLVPHGRGVRLEVADDGVGFNPEHVNGDRHGLRNLRSRASNIRAQLEIISKPGAGTRVVLDIPFSHDNH